MIIILQHCKLFNGLILNQPCFSCLFTPSRRIAEMLQSQPSLVLSLIPNLYNVWVRVAAIEDITTGLLWTCPKYMMHMFYACNVFVYIFLKPSSRNTNYFFNLFVCHTWGAPSTQLPVKTWGILMKRKSGSYEKHQNYFPMGTRCSCCNTTHGTSPPARDLLHWSNWHLHSHFLNWCS